MTPLTPGKARFVTRLIAIFIAALALAPGVRADVGLIELNQIARVAPGAPMLLRDVATLEGAPALALAETVIYEPDPGSASFEITIGQVRTALTQRQANWGRLTLRGSTCQVRVGERRPTPSARAALPVKAAPATVDLTGPRTVRTRLAELVGRLFGVENDDLRLRFDDRDAAILNRSIGERSRVEIQPASSASSSRMAFVIWVYEAETLEPTSSTVRVEVMLRQPIVTATREIQRDDEVLAESLTTSVRWVEPNGSALISDPEQAAGMRARRKIPAGSVLRAESLEPPIACERGDLVKVHCISGGIVVKAWARAQGTAREGESVVLRLAGSDKTFQARMTGRGVAVMDIGS